jgi:hypothetical protein
MFFLAVISTSSNDTAIALSTSHFQTPLPLTFATGYPTGNAQVTNLEASINPFPTIEEYDKR